MNPFKQYVLVVLICIGAQTGFADNLAPAASDAARILMLENALAPKSALEAAKLFAKANKERNGAVQFMLFSDELKTKYKDYWPNWVSGVSSPWIKSYDIKHVKNTSTFEIQYHLATSSGSFGSLIQTIQIQSNPNKENTSQKFLITQLKEIENLKK